MSTVSNKMKMFAEKSSWIRKMFEQGAKMKAEFGQDNVFDFSLGNPDLPPPEKFKDVLQGLAADETPGFHKYMLNKGYDFVRAKVAATISREQEVSIDADDMLMTCGAAGGLNVALKAILDAGDEVIILAPFFVEYKFYVDNQGGTPVVVNTAEDFDIDCAAIEEAINDKTKAVIINSPNNPTGQIYSKESLARLGEVLAAGSSKHGRTICLISDEPYRKIVFDDHEVPSIFKAYANSIVVSSYSKDLSLPGERIGYVAVNPEIEEKKILLGTMTMTNRILGFINAPAFMQRAVAELQGESVDNDIYTRRRKIFCDILEKCGYEFMAPKGTFYIFPKSPIENDVDFVKILAKHRILAVPGQGFGTPGYFRLAFCVEDKVIENSATAFKAAIEEARG